MPSWWFIRWAVRRSGGRALRLTPGRPRPELVPDAVIISGGEDIAPDLYGGVLHGTAVPADSARDAFELRVLDTALKRKLPVLGICRGAQLINVALGGTLHQDLRELRRRTSNRRTLLACKTLAVGGASRLAAIIGPRRARINSLHHQAIARRAPGLRVCGRDADAIVQAVEGRGDQWLLGVQWHPEYLPYRPRQRRLFRALVAAARQSRLSTDSSTGLSAGSSTSLP